MWSTLFTTQIVSGGSQFSKDGSISYDKKNIYLVQVYVNTFHSHDVNFLTEESSAIK